MVAALSAVGCLGPGESVSAVIGSQGGVLESRSGARVLIPAGALADPKFLTLTVVEAGPGRVEVFLSPTDTTFAREVALEVRYTTDGDPGLFRFGTTTWVPVSDVRVQTAARLIVGKTRLAGEFVAASAADVGVSCAGPSDAGSGHGGYDAGEWHPGDGGFWGPQDGGHGGDDDGGSYDADAGHWGDDDGGSYDADAGHWGDYDGGSYDADAGHWGGYDGGSYGGGGWHATDAGHPIDWHPADGGGQGHDGGGFSWGDADAGWGVDPWMPDGGWTAPSDAHCLPPQDHPWMDGGVRAGEGTR